MTDEELNGWFDLHRRRLSQKYPFYRSDTFLLAFREIMHIEAPIIVETGCTRHADNGEDGASTLMFAEYCRALRPRGRVFSIDIRDESLAECRRLLAGAGLSEFSTLISGNSIEQLPILLRGLQRVDLLYLDSHDCNLDVLYESLSAQRHCLAELMAAMPYLKRDTILLLDDGQSPSGGKSRIIKRDYLMDAPEWERRLESYQSVWRKVR